MNRINAIFYHGTTEDVVASIKREGLRPEMARSYNFLNLRGIVAKLLDTPGPFITNDRTHDGFVFLTADFTAAELFAQFRATYEMYPPDSLLKLGQMSMYKQAGEYQRMGTQPGTPVVLEFHIPKSIAKLVLDDERADNQLQGYMYKGTLPARTLKKVIPVEGWEGLEYDPQEARFKKAA